MARSFNGSSDWINGGSASAFAFTPSSPFTVSFWMQTSTSVGAGVTRGLVGRWTATSPVPNAGWFVALNTNRIYFQIQKNGTTFRYRVGDTVVTDGTGRWITCTYDGSTNATGLRIFVNGVEDTYFDTQSAGTLDSMACNDGFNIGRRIDGLYYTGSLAELGIWSAVPVAGDIAALGKGVSPRAVLPGSLIDCLPLIGRASPEIAVRGVASGTLTGTSQAAHPSVYYPARPSRTVFAATSPPPPPPPASFLPAYAAGW